MFLHLYSVEGFIWFRLSYVENGTVTGTELLRNAVQIVDAPEVLCYMMGFLVSRDERTEITEMQPADFAGKFEKDLQTKEEVRELIDMAFESSGNAYKRIIGGSKKISRHKAKRLRNIIGD